MPPLLTGAAFSLTSTLDSSQGQHQTTPRKDGTTVWAVLRRDTGTGKKTSLAPTPFKKP